MTTPQTDKILRSWIATRDPGPAPATLRASVERSIQELGPAPLTRRRWRFSFAVAAAVIVAVGGVALLAYLDAGRTKVASPPSPFASPSMPSDPVLPSTGRLEPGRYVTTTAGIAVHLTVPAEWSGNGMGVGRSSGSGWQSPIDLIVTPYDISYIAEDLCAKDADVKLVPVDPGVPALTNALAHQRGVLRAGPSEVTLGGYPAQKFVMSLPTSCPGAEGHGLWADRAGAWGYWLKPLEIGTVYIVDIDGDRLVITTQYGPRASRDAVDELETIVSSIAIEARPGARPTKTAEPGGWLPGGPHSITVDGVPFTFSVTPLVQDSGWTLYAGTEVSKDIVASQDAEAIVYWTAYPEGAHTDRCARLDLPLHGPIADIAGAIARTPGTTLVTGPTDATIGDRPAAHVVVKVVEDLGCDPKYFFTSEAPAGGPGWWETSVGATIQVWLVDVDGTRLFVAVESKPTASPELLQEAEDIVASIRFE